MKKIVTLLLVLIIGISMSITVYATDAQQVYNDDLQTILKDQLEETEYQKLLNKNYYHSSMTDIVLENKPILKVYNQMYWEFFHLPIGDIVEYANSEKIIDYIVFEKSPIRLRAGEFNSGYTISLVTNRESKPMSDIYKISTNMTVSDTSCTVTGIYFFDGFSSHMGACVYYLTSEENFVKYYQDELSEGIWFKESEYNSFAEQYYSYLISPENNYNEDGEPMGGGTLSFLEFIADFTLSFDDKNDITFVQSNKNDTSLVPSDTPTNGIYGFVGAIVFGIIVMGCIGVFFCRTIRKKKVFYKKE